MPSTAGGDAPAANKEGDDFQEGARVVLSGLKAQLRYDGRQGVVVLGLSEDGRVGARLDPVRCALPGAVVAESVVVRPSAPCVRLLSAG